MMNGNRMTKISTSNHHQPQPMSSSSSTSSSSLSSGTSSTKITKICNDDKCIICYNLHSKDGEKPRVPFTFKELKNIFSKSFSVQFLPSFTINADVVHMCQKCHQKFLELQTIYEEFTEVEQRFNSFREKFAFTVVESVFTSDYLNNNYHGNPFDTLRYLVFKEWSPKFKQNPECVKKVRITRDKQRHFINRNQGGGGGKHYVNSSTTVASSSSSNASPAFFPRPSKNGYHPQEVVNSSHDVNNVVIQQDHSKADPDNSNDNFFSSVDDFQVDITPVDDDDADEYGKAYFGSVDDENTRSKRKLQSLSSITVSTVHPSSSNSVNKLQNSSKKRATPQLLRSLLSVFHKHPNVDLSEAKKISSNNSFVPAHSFSTNNGSTSSIKMSTSTTSTSSTLPGKRMYTILTREGHDDPHKKPSKIFQLAPEENKGPPPSSTQASSYSSQHIEDLFHKQFKPLQKEKQKETVADSQPTITNESAESTTRKLRSSIRNNSKNQPDDNNICQSSNIQSSCDDSEDDESSLKILSVTSMSEEKPKSNSNNLETDDSSQNAEKSQKSPRRSAHRFLKIDGSSKLASLRARRSSNSTSPEKTVRFAKTVSTGKDVESREGKRNNASSNSEGNVRKKSKSSSGGGNQSSSTMETSTSSATTTATSTDVINTSESHRSTRKRIPKNMYDSDNWVGSSEIDQLLKSRGSKIGITHNQRTPPRK